MNLKSISQRIRERFPTRQPQRYLLVNRASPVYGGIPTKGQTSRNLRPATPWVICKQTISGVALESAEDIWQTHNVFWIVVGYFQNQIA